MTSCSKLGFSNLSRAVDYFQLFFTDSLINQIVQYTNQYAQIEITKKRRTQPNYIDKQWSLDGSDNVSCEEMRAYLGACVRKIYLIQLVRK